MTTITHSKLNNNDIKHTFSAHTNERQPHYNMRHVKHQGPGMKPRTGSTKIKIAETVGIIHLYPHMKVSQSFGDNFFGDSSPRFHPRALT